MARRFGLRSGLVGILFSLACISILWRQVSLRQSWQALSALSAPLLLLPLIVLILNLPLRAWRWHLIFPRPSRPGFWSCLTVLGVGNMANFLLPGRAGDVSRCVLIGPTGTWHEGSRALATLALEKILDGLALIAMLLLSTRNFPLPLWVFKLVDAATIVFLLALAFLLFAHYRSHRVVDFARTGSRLLHFPALELRIERLVASFAEGVAAVASPVQMLLLLALTAAIWITEIILVWGLANALHLTISLSASAMATAVLGLGLMIPAAPGGLGTYELFGTEVFKVAGLAAARGLTLTVVIHAWVFVTNIALGLLLLAAQGVSLAQLKRRVDGIAPDSTEIPPNRSSA